MTQATQSRPIPYGELDIWGQTLADAWVYSIYGRAGMQTEYAFLFNRDGAIVGAQVISATVPQ